MLQAQSKIDKPNCIMKWQQRNKNVHITFIASQNEAWSCSNFILCIKLLEVKQGDANI